MQTPARHEKCESKIEMRALRATVSPPRSRHRKRSGSSFQARQTRFADFREVRLEPERGSVDLGGRRRDKLEVELEAFVGDQCREQEASLEVTVSYDGNASVMVGCCRLPSI